MSSSSDGFAAVAEWIALDPDNEPFIFRKFDRLAARNLLYLQAQIMMLEQEIEKLDQHAAQSDDMSLKDAARRWEQLVKQNAEGQEHAQRQVKLIAEIKHALKEYCKYLIPWHSRLDAADPTRRNPHSPKPGLTLAPAQPKSTGRLQRMVQQPIPHSRRPVQTLSRRHRRPRRSHSTERLGLDLKPTEAVLATKRSKCTRKQQNTTEGKRPTNF